jgi:ribose transport system substrate-binding protein
MRYLTRRAAGAATTTLALIALALLVAACGSSSSSSTGSSAPTGEAGATETGASSETDETETTASTGGSCGTIPTAPAVQDPDGAFAKLGLTGQEATYFEGWSHPIEESAFADWKPKGSGPYKVIYVGGVVANEFYAATQKEIVAKLEESPLVEKGISVTAPSSFTAIGEQLQQYNAAVQQDPDLIIFDPISPTATTHYVEAAAKKGIPTVSIFQAIESPDAVSVIANGYEDATKVASSMTTAMEGKGTVLEVLGTPTAPITTSEQEAWKGVFATCPEIEIVGSAEGEFSTTVAKTATLQYLSTHPGGVDGVIETAAMAQGILQAFEQAGTSMPVIGQIQAEKSVNAYWLEHQSEGYEGAAMTAGSGDLSTLFSKVVLRMLEGGGPKINYVPWPYGEVTGKNLEEFTDPSWTTATPGVVDNLQQYEMSEEGLESLFSNPKKAG